MDYFIHTCELKMFTILFSGTGVCLGAVFGLYRVQQVKKDALNFCIPMFWICVGGTLGFIPGIAIDSFLLGKYLSK